MYRRTDHPDTHRRRLLKAFAAAPFFATPIAAGAALSETTLEARLAALAASNISSARSIGRAYLSLDRSEADKDDLVRAVLDRMDLAPAVLNRSNTTTLQSLIDRAIRLDFCQYDTVQLDGWVLSRTEARLCAIASLVG
jgi:hypothetical protein